MTTPKLSTDTRTVWLTVVAVMLSKGAEPGYAKGVADDACMEFEARFPKAKTVEGGFM